VHWGSFPPDISEADFEIGEAGFGWNGSMFNFFDDRWKPANRISPLYERSSNVRGARGSHSGMVQPRVLPDFGRSAELLARFRALHLGIISLLHYSGQLASRSMARPGRAIILLSIVDYDSVERMPLISVVDDDESVREAIEGLMKAMGFDAEVFPSAEDFLNSGRAAATACMIADVQMPGMSGLELQARLKAAGHGIPFIFITAFPDERVRTKALERGGAVCFLNKPFSEEELIAGIGLALKGPSP
jgi:CheY-like chemotaxis protein